MAQGHTIRVGFDVAFRYLTLKRLADTMKLYLRKADSTNARLRAFTIGDN